MGRIDVVAALAMLQAGACKADVARRFGVSRAAVTMRLRGLWPAPTPPAGAGEPSTPGMPAAFHPEPTGALLALLARREPEAAATLRQGASRLELRPDLVLVYVRGSWFVREPMERLYRRKRDLEAVWGRPVAFKWSPSA